MSQNIDVKACYVSQFEQAELNNTRAKLQLYFPQHTVNNLQKPKNFRKLCNEAANYQNVALNDKLLSGTDLLQSLTGIFFRIREHQVATSANIGAIFLQVALQVITTDA